MRTLLLMALLAAAPVVVAEHGISVKIPAGWAASKDGTTFIYSAKDKDAQLRIDLFEKQKVDDKEKGGDAQACVDQLIGKLASADKAADSYASATVAGQPAATQVSLDEDGKHVQKRIVGCDGKRYFLIDWLELKTVGPKYEKTYAALLAGITYAKK